MTRTAVVSAVFLSLLIGSTAAADVLDQTATINGTTVEYKVIRPRDFDPAKTYPAVLAFPPGDQSMLMVMVGVDYNYRAEAERRGYLVIEPAAPGGVGFVRGGDKIFPAFIEKILADYKIEGGKFNGSGQSNGGRAVFKIAADYPQYFLSVTGFPGRLENADASAARYAREALRPYVCRRGRRSLAGRLSRSGRCSSHARRKGHLRCGKGRGPCARYGRK